MAKVSQKPLQPNPFFTYRDPTTGQWIVIQGQSPAHLGDNLSSKSADHLSLSASSSA